jgi:hypothetical protein
MRTFEKLLVIVTCTTLTSFTALFPNPVDPTQYVVLSEVQIGDSTNWTVEFLFSNNFSNMVLKADTFTYNYSLVNQAIDSSYHPKITVKQNGYGLITPLEYPTLKLHPGDTVKLRCNTGLWECAIDKDIKPTQSMAAYQSFKNYGPTGLGKSPYVQWCKDASPTLGYANDSNGIYGALRVIAYGKDSTPLQNFQSLFDVPCSAAASGMQLESARTDSFGQFLLTNLISADSRSFFFPGKSAGTYGPFSPEPECTTNAFCRLNDYPPAPGAIAVIKGTVCDQDSIPVSNFLLYGKGTYFCGQLFTFTFDSTSTDSNGNFYLTILHPPLSNIVTLTAANGAEVFGQFTIVPGCTTSVVCKLISNASTEFSRHSGQSLSVEILNATKQQRTHSVLIVFNGSSTGNEYDLCIFSVSGKKLFETNIPGSGSGTYSVSWNSGSHSGTYIARVRSQSTSVEKRFIIK